MGKLSTPQYEAMYDRQEKTLWTTLQTILFNDEVEEPVESAVPDAINLIDGYDSHQMYHSHIADRLACQGKGGLDH